MAIVVRCKRCGRGYRVSDERAGSVIRCRKCGSPIKVPLDVPLDSNQLPPRVGQHSGRARRSGGSARSPKHDSNKGLVIGGIVGGVLVLIIVLVFALMPSGKPAVQDQSQAVNDNSSQSEAAGADTKGPTEAAAPDAKSAAAPATATATNWSVEIDGTAESATAASTANIEIPVPPNNGTNNLVFPSTCSTFVAAGINFVKKDVREVWDLRTSKRVGVVQGELSTFRGALSPDGRYYAGYSKSNDRILLFDVRESKEVGEIALKTSQAVKRLMFARSDRLVMLVFGEPVLVWAVPSGQSERTIEMPKYFEETSGTVSPGGRYLALIAHNGPAASYQLCIYDLDTGKTVGEVRLRKYSEYGAPHCSGMAFSPDGRELAAVIDSSQQFWLVCWDVATGKQVAEFKLRSKLKDAAHLGGSQSRSIGWFPNRKRWLLFGSHVFDREAGDVVWSLPKQFNPLERRVLDNERIVAVAGEFKDMVLRTVKLPGKRIAQSAQAIQVGGLPEDAGLPPLTKADRSSAKLVTLDASPAKWRVPIDPASPVAPSILKSPIPLRGGGDTIDRVFVSQNGASAALSLDTGMKKNVPLVIDDYDLAAGTHAGTVEVPYPAELLSISPDGTRVLVRAKTSLGRIDIWSLKDGKHLAGWRPYRKAGKDKDRVEAGAWVNSDHVLSLSSGHELVLWKMLACQAVYTVENVQQGATTMLQETLRQIDTALLKKLERIRSGRLASKPAAQTKPTGPIVNKELPTISPGGKTLAIRHEKRLMFLDATTGDVLGAVQAPGPLGAAAFHPSGEKFAATFARPGGGWFIVWNLKDGQIEYEFPLPQTGHTLHWCSDQYLLLDASALISLKHGMIVWSYVAPDAVHAAGTPDGRHWCVVKKSRNSQSLCLAALRLPEEPLAAKLAQKNAKPQLILQPGGQVSLRLSVKAKPPGDPDLESKIHDHLVQNLKDHGIGVTGGQELTFQVTVTQKNSGRHCEFTQFGRGDGTPFSQRPKTLVSETIVECRVVVKQKNEVVWETSTQVSNIRLFTITHIRPGETVQQNLARQQWDRVTSYLLELELPSHLFAKNAAQGLGQSLLTAQGPVSTPGP